MLYRDLAEVYERLEGTSGRLEMTEILVDLFQDLDCDDLGRIVYLTQGKIHPDFFPQKLGLADRLVLKAVAFASRLSEGEVESIWLREGDLGLVAEEAMTRSVQTFLFHEELGLDRVYRTMEAIEAEMGSRSQDGKIKLLVQLLKDASPLEARYLVRTVGGKMRLGVANMTVVEGLSQAFAERSDRPIVERAYNVTSDLGMVAETLCRDGLDGVKLIQVMVGNPIRAMLAERLPSLHDILERLDGHCAFEYKYDGLRVQAHKRGDEVRLFSRRLEDLTPQFPDVAKAIGEALGEHDAIVEGECVPIDLSTGDMLPFQEVSHRRGRKHGLSEAIEDHPVKTFLFDCLWFNGDLTDSPLPIRRQALEDAVRITDKVELSRMELIEDESDAEAFFTRALSDGCEGLMAKSIAPESVYRAGARGYLWIKYKKDYQSDMSDTVDLVVVGAFAGRGKRRGTYGALLMATYDPEMDRYETVCKLGTGFDDEALAAIPAMLEQNRVGATPDNVVSKMEADFWFRPSLVLEVLGAELTVSPIHTAASRTLGEGSGLAIRFPRFTGRFRDDKDATDSTTSQELLSMYEVQRKVLQGVGER